MKLGIFMMPVHPLHRNHTETLKEDRETVILADQLGFHDAFIGEHLTDKAENITNSLLFLATLIHSTQRIKLASGTCNLSQIHPTVVAANAAMFDHLAEGRFILGVSPGALVSDAEALGILDEDRNKMFSEAIDVILDLVARAALRHRPAGQPLQGDDEEDHAPRDRRRHHAQALSEAAPEIVGTVVAPFSKGVVLMGERDFHPLGQLPAAALAEDALGELCRGQNQGRREPDPAEWRVARTVFVADDDKVAAAYGRHDANSPYRFYYRQLQTKLTKAGRHAVFKERLDQPDHEITYEFVLDRLCIYGTVNKVVDQILRCASRWATSASWSTPAWIGSTRSSPGARCSSWPRKSCRASTRLLRSRQASVNVQDLARDVVRGGRAEEEHRADHVRLGDAAERNALLQPGARRVLQPMRAHLGAHHGGRYAVHADALGPSSAACWRTSMTRPPLEVHKWSSRGRAARAARAPRAGAPACRRAAGAPRPARGTWRP